MPVRQITACLVVEENDASEVTEALLSLIDSFIVKNLPVFDSDICSKPIDALENADEIRREVERQPHSGFTEFSNLNRFANECPKSPA
jgi:hypothetical protein